MVDSHLDTAGIPDPDVIIRTSGEQRLSNFLIWQAAYSEFVFLPIQWPDFDRGSFAAALAEFAARDRRSAAWPCRRNRQDPSLTERAPLRRPDRQLPEKCFHQRRNMV